MQNNNVKFKIQEIVSSAIVRGLFSSCVIGIVKENGERIVLPFGEAREDSLFDVASVTKAIPTALSLLYLIEADRVRIDDRVIEILPEVHNASREELRVRHLLTHTAGYSEEFRLSSLKHKNPEEILRAVFFAPLTHEPGEYFAYTNTASIVLGFLVERISGKTLHEFAKEVFFDPMGMARIGFFPLELFSAEEIAPTEICAWRGREVRGEVHDESAWKLGQADIMVGSAGLFSSVSDLLTILEMLIRGGEYGGRRYFSEEMVARMYQNHLFGIGSSHGLGWELCNRRWMGGECGERAFGKTGFTGCSVMCDPDRGIGLVILSNYTYPKRKPDSSPINEFRRDIADIVFAR